MQDLQQFGTVYYLDCQSIFLNGVFLGSGLTKSFAVCDFQNKVGMTIIFFFKMFKI